MLKVTPRPTVQTSEVSSQLQIIFKPDIPNKLKIILKDLYYPVPRFFNAKILKSEHFLEILQYVVSWPSLDSLYFNTVKNHGISNTSLLKQLTIISFSNLQQLYLENMKLDNFQLLQFIQCPNLRMIYLMGNDVRTLKSLAKSNWKKLQKIEINAQIGVQQLMFLERIRMSANGQVSNSQIDEDSKTNKKRDSTKIHDSLLMIWPKLEGKRYAHLIEERKNLQKKRF